MADETNTEQEISPRVATGEDWMTFNLGEQIADEDKQFLL